MNQQTVACEPIILYIRSKLCIQFPCYSTLKTESTGVSVRHIQCILFETFRADNSDVKISCPSAFLDVGRKMSSSTETYVYTGIVPVPKTVSETNDNRPTSVLSPTHASSSLAFFEKQPDTPSLTFFDTPKHLPSSHRQS